MWVTFYLDHDRLPWRRVLVRFDYPTLSGPGSRGWLLIERNDAEVCEKHPGGEEHLVVVVNARSHLGLVEWGLRCVVVASASLGRQSYVAASRRGTALPRSSPAGEPGRHWLTALSRRRWMCPRCERGSLTVPARGPLGSPGRRSAGLVLAARSGDGCR
jgi:hypothetical protein